MKTTRATSRRSMLAATIALTALCASPWASASHQRTLSTLERLQQAELVFEGVVTDIQYRTSVATTPDQPELPHTYVTFQIERLHLGSVDTGNTVTLRFLGGFAEDGSYLDISGIPTFEMGDREILFVRQNGRKACPLVGWEQGRFRVVRGQVFHSQGEELYMGRDGSLHFGPAGLELSGARARPLSTTERRRNDSEGGEVAPPAGTLRPDAKSFGDFMEIAVRDLARAGMLRPMAMTRSSDLRKSFSVPALRQASTSMKGKVKRAR